MFTLSFCIEIMNIMLIKLSLNVIFVYSIHHFMKLLNIIKIKLKKITLVPYVGLSLLLSFSVLGSENSILVQSTTSTENSGFYDYILPLFASDTGVNVNIVAVGTGAAIKNARNCDGDVLFVHSPKHEVAFVAQGFAKKRYDVMHNDFLLVGPNTDPAEIIGIKDVGLAFKKIMTTGAKFASRSDNSGTHSKELSIWKDVGLNPETGSGKWYFETGSGMGTTLNIAIGISAYTLVDRASWYSFSNKYDFRIILEGDIRLFNPYSIMLINKDKCPQVKSKKSQLFIDWLVSDRGQRAIKNFKIDGHQVFTPNAKSRAF